ncbi:hypothetical protein Vadar_033233 [Vaccinium darrowii]|uniref:Uncharacterized protein n=1 Tax=Vaccinium darrowii TaxID=229202 RepID=A0ACB7XLJ8_9ERIC|nr:hypothetical protein Vadar_033233 [Vaccinium darrowii]
MDDSNLPANNNNSNDNDHFFDALDDFPFYDCLDVIEPNSPPISQQQGADDDTSLKPRILSPSSLRRRRSWSHHTRNETSCSDLKNSDPNSTVCSDSTSRVERKYKISRSLKENERASEKPDSIRSANEGETKENSTVTTANDDTVDDLVALDSASGGNNESSFNFLFVLAGLLIKAISFQTSLLVNFVTFPIWLLYCAYMFVIDPLRAVRRGREYVTARVLRMWGVVCDNVKPFLFEWLKEHKSVWRLALRLGWGFLWASYVCVVLISLLVLAFIVSGFIMRHLVEEPIQRKETLTFDYTKNSPVAYVQVISCPGETRGVSNREKIEFENLGAPRVIPPKHKLQATVSLTLPESDYNKNLGIFQVRVDFLSASGKALASSRQPCMLRFKSEPLRLLLTFLKVVPLITGYSSEAQTLTLCSSISESVFFIRLIPSSNILTISKNEEHGGLVLSKLDDCRYSGCKVLQICCLNH